VAQLDKMRATGAMDRGGKTVSIPINCRDNVGRPAVAAAQPIKEQGSVGRVLDGCLHIPVNSLAVNIESYWTGWGQRNKRPVFSVADLILSSVLVGVHV
jgi:hypothetical protein